MMSLFTYFTESSKEDAQVNAKKQRIHLMRHAIDYYKKIEKAYEKSTDNPQKETLRAFLNKFYQEIFALNSLNTPTTAMNTFITRTSYQFLLDTVGDVDLDDHEVKTVNEALSCLSAQVSQEELNTKSYRRTIAKNQQLKLKYDAIYCASLPTLGIIGGVIAACLTSATLYALGIPISVFLLTQTIYWALNYSLYDGLVKQITNDAFEPILAEGTALSFHELPDTICDKERHEERKKALALRAEHSDPVLMTPFADQLMGELVDEGSYLLETTTTQVTDTAHHMAAAVQNWSLGMWSSAVHQIATQFSDAPKEHLHTL